MVAAELVAAVAPAAAVPVAAEAAKAAAVVAAEAVEPVEPVGVAAPAEAEVVAAPVEAAAALEVPEAVHHLLRRLRVPAQVRKFSGSSTRISKFPAVHLTHSSVEQPFEVLLLKPSSSIRSDISCI